MNVLPKQPLPNAPVVLIHPQFSGASSYIMPLLESRDRAGLLVTLDEQNKRLGAAIQRALIEQHYDQLQTKDDSDFSNSSIDNVQQHLDRIAPYCLILDEIDLLDTPEEVEALRTLLLAVPEGSQIVLNGRTLSWFALADPAIRACVALNPVDERIMLVDYLHPPNDKILLEVYALGPGRVLIDGRPIHSWDGPLPRTLFHHLIDRGMATRDAIFEAFWPALSAREATNVFHVTKRKVNEILGFDLTDYTSGYYQLSPLVELCYDVVKFAEAVQNGQAEVGEDAILWLERAIHLYRRDFLSGLQQPWALARRAELRSTYAEALAMLADLYHVAGDVERATGYYTRAISAQRLQDQDA